MAVEEFDLHIESEKFARCIGDNVRRLREEKKWTQDRLAEELGISRLSVSKLERGEFEKLNISNIVACAKLFGCSTDVFFMNKDEIARRFLATVCEKMDIDSDEFMENMTSLKSHDSDYSKIVPKRASR